MSEHLCTLCGHPMPAGEEMFKFHGYSGECPSPPAAVQEPVAVKAAAKILEEEVQSLDDTPPSIQSQANIRLIDAARILIRAALSTSHSDPAPSLVDQLERMANIAEDRLVEIAALRAENERLRGAANDVVQSASNHYKKRNGHLASFQDDSGEMCWIVPFDPFEGLRAALSEAQEGRK